MEYLSIDRDVRWLPNWVERPRGDQRDILTQLVGRARWVMDGSGASTFDLRVPRADLIVWIRVPRRVALRGLVRRVWRNYGTVRVGMAKGCREPIPDWGFLSYIWQFEHKSAPQFVQQIDRFSPDIPVVVLRSHTQAARLLQ